MGKHYLGIDTAFDMVYYSRTHHLGVFVQPTTHVALIYGEKTIRIWKIHDAFYQWANIKTRNGWRTHIVNIIGFFVMYAQ